MHTHTTHTQALGTVPEVQGEMHAVATTSGFIDNKSVPMETEPSLPESEVAALKKKVRFMMSLVCT